MRPLVVLVPLERLVDPEEVIEEIVDTIFLPRSNSGKAANAPGWARERRPA